MSYQYKKIKLPDGTTRDEHRLKMEEKLGRRLERWEVVHHIDGNKMNNDLDNLELMHIRKHNQLHLTGKPLAPSAYENRTTLRGEQQSQAILKDEQIPWIRAQYDAGVPIKEIAKALGVSRHCIGKVARRQNWLHIPEENNPPMPK